MCTASSNERRAGKLAKKLAIVTPPLANDALMQLFASPPKPSRLDEVWGQFRHSSTIKRERNTATDLLLLMTDRRMKLSGFEGRQRHQEGQQKKRKRKSGSRSRPQGLGIQLVE